MYSFGLGTGKRQIMRTEKDLVVKVGFKQARESMCFCVHVSSVFYMCMCICECMCMCAC